MQLYRGVVEDNNSPLKDGKVRVRILGVHSENKELVKTEELPWAEIMGSVSFSGSGIGLTNIPNIGTWVFVIFDFEDFNKPIVIGSILGKSEEMPDTSIGFCDPSGNLPIKDRLSEYDTNRLTRVENLDKTIHQDINDSDNDCAGFNIPGSSSDLSVYPDNVVYEDKAGNIIEVDSTEGNERFRIFHSKSKTRIEIDKDGNVITNTTKNLWNKIKGLFSIDAEKDIIIKGNVKIIGNVEITEQLSAGSRIKSSTEIEDGTGKLSALRDAYTATCEAYDSHTHIGNLGAPTSPKDLESTPDEFNLEDPYSWSSSPL